MSIINLRFATASSEVMDPVQPSQEYNKLILEKFGLPAYLKSHTRADQFVGFIGLDIQNLPGIENVRQRLSFCYGYDSKTCKA